MKKWIVVCIFAVLVIGMVLLSGCIIGTNSSQIRVTQLGSWQIRVTYPGDWYGNYWVDDITKIEHIYGPGTQTYHILPPTDWMDVDVSKNDDSSQRLTVEILRDGTVVASKYTDKPHGEVDITYRT